MSEELKRRGRLAAALMAGPAVTVGMLGAGAAPALAQDEIDPEDTEAVEESVEEAEPEGDSDESTDGESNDDGDDSGDDSTNDESSDDGNSDEGDDAADGSGEDSDDETDASNEDEDASGESSEDDSDDGSEESAEGEDGEDDVDPADVDEPETEPEEFTTFQEDGDSEKDFDNQLNERQERINELAENPVDLVIPGRDVSANPEDYFTTTEEPTPVYVWSSEQEENVVIGYVPAESVLLGSPNWDNESDEYITYYATTDDPLLSEQTGLDFGFRVVIEQAAPITDEAQTPGEDASEPAVPESDAPVVTIPGRDVSDRADEYTIVVTERAPIYSSRADTSEEPLGYLEEGAVVRLSEWNEDQDPDMPGGFVTVEDALIEAATGQLSVWIPTDYVSSIGEDAATPAEDAPSPELPEVDVPTLSVGEPSDYGEYWNLAIATRTAPVYRWENDQYEVVAYLPQGAVVEYWEGEDAENVYNDPDAPGTWISVWFIEGDDEVEYNYGRVPAEYVRQFTEGDIPEDYVEDDDDPEVYDTPKLTLDVDESEVEIGDTLTVTATWDPEDAEYGEYGFRDPEGVDQAMGIWLFMEPFNQNGENLLDGGRLEDTDRFGQLMDENSSLRFVDEGPGKRVWEFDVVSLPAVELEAGQQLVFSSAGSFYATEEDAETQDLTHFESDELSVTIIGSEDRTPPSGGDDSGESESGVELSIDSNEVAAGDQVTLVGEGFEAGEDVVFDLNPALGTFGADDEGVVTAEVTIPEDTEPGEHTITATGQSSGLSDSVTVTVVEPTGAAPAGDIGTDADEPAAQAPADEADDEPAAKAPAAADAADEELAATGMNGRDAGLLSGLLLLVGGGLAALGYKNRLGKRSADA